MIQTNISFDDGSIYDLRTADLLKRYNLNAVFFIPVNWQRYLLSKGIDPLTVDNLRDLASQFEIGSHGVNHELLTRSDNSKIDQEIFDSYEFWQKTGYKVTGFCYPRGYYNEDIKNKVKEAGYTWARTVKVCELLPPSDPFETHTTVHIGLDRKEYGTDWLTFAKDKLEEALERSAMGEEIHYNIFGHSEEIHRYQQWSRVEELLRLISETTSS